MKKKKILVIDDEESLLTMFRDLLAYSGYYCRTSLGDDDEVQLIRDYEPDAVILDLKLPRKSGIEILKNILNERRDLKVMVLTGYGSYTSVMEALSIGAIDFATKPITPEELKDRIDRIFWNIDLTKTPIKQRQDIRLTSEFMNLVGKSTVMNHVYHQIRRVSKSPANVMICGETGTGKELIAKAIHQQSDRASQPFIPIDCLTCADTLLESELFGHEKGAFTGANKHHIGLLKSAHGGTVFLDELTKLDINTQAKLLRTIEDRKLRPVGALSYIPIDVRILSATNINPEYAIEKNLLLPDLYYRLNVLSISIPPLRDRENDIIFLSQHFFEQLAADYKKEIPEFTQDAKQLMQIYEWPGNVRQLRNVCEQVIVHYDKDTKITAEILRGYLNLKPTYDFLHKNDDILSLPYKEAKNKFINKFEQKYIEDLIIRHNYNYSTAAKDAEVSRTTIHRLFNDHHGLSSRFN